MNLTIFSFWYGEQYGRQFLKKLNRELPHDPAILLLGTYLEELKAEPQTGIYPSTLTAALFTTATKWKHPEYPGIDE